MSANTNDKIPGSKAMSTPVPSYDFPPSYEESLAHPALAEFCQAAAASPYYQNYSFPYAAQATVPQSYQQSQLKSAYYPIQHYPMLYQQQAAQYIPVTQSAQGVYQPAYYPGQQVIVPGGFDAGARYDMTMPPSVPPPPPGVAPNAAQLAMQSGAQVVVTKKNNSFLTGGQGAGYSFW